MIPPFAHSRNVMCIGSFSCPCRAAAAQQAKRGGTPHKPRCRKITTPDYENPLPIVPFKCLSHLPLGWFASPASSWNRTPGSRWPPRWNPLSSVVPTDTRPFWLAGSSTYREENFPVPNSPCPPGCSVDSSGLFGCFRLPVCSALKITTARTRFHSTHLANLAEIWFFATFHGGGEGRKHFDRDLASQFGELTNTDTSDQSQGLR